MAFLVSSIGFTGGDFIDFGPGLMALGPAYLILLVMLCQTIVYREVTALFALTSRKTLSDQDGADGRAARDPWSKTFNWYFFAVTNYFLYGESIIYYFKVCIFHVACLRGD